MHGFHYILFLCITNITKNKRKERWILEVRKNAAKGAVYLLQDTSSEYLRTQDDRKHNYLIIATKDVSSTKSTQGYIQCMCITSQQNHDVTWEVPIVMSNGTIGYVVPYNIFSYSTDEFSIDRFRGNLMDTEWGTIEDFIHLLMDIFLVTRKIKNNSKKIKKRLDEYNEWFFKEYDEKKEYRVIKQEDAAFKKETLFSRPEITDDSIMPYVYKPQVLESDDYNEKEDSRFKSQQRSAITIRTRKNNETIEDIIREVEEDKAIEDSTNDITDLEPETDIDEAEETVYSTDENNSIGSPVITDGIAEELVKGLDQPPIPFRPFIRKKIVNWTDEQLELYNLEVAYKNHAKYISDETGISISKIYEKLGDVKKELHHRENARTN